MATFNLRYDLEQPTNLPGMVADSRVTHTVTGKAAEAIAPGQPVGYDGLIAAAVGTPLKGVARLQTSLEQTDAGLVQYAIGDDVPLVSFGPVWVQASKAVAAGAYAYAIISGGNKGKFTDTSAGTTTNAPVGWFESTTTGAANAVLFVSRQTAVGGA
jgi:hypothetical protein